MTNSRLVLVTLAVLYALPVYVDAAESCNIQTNMRSNIDAVRLFMPPMFQYTDKSIPHPREQTDWWGLAVTVTADERTAIENAPLAQISKKTVTDSDKQLIVDAYLSDGELFTIGVAATIAGGFLSGGASVALGITSSGLLAMANADEKNKISVGDTLIRVEEYDAESEILSRKLFLKSGSEYYTLIEANCELNDK